MNFLSLSLYIYIYTLICVYIYMYVYIYIYVYKYIYIYVYIYICTNICVYSIYNISLVLKMEAEAWVETSEAWGTLSWSPSGASPSVAGESARCGHQDVSQVAADSSTETAPLRSDGHQVTTTQCASVKSNIWNSSHGRRSKDIKSQPSYVWISNSFDVFFLPIQKMLDFSGICKVD